MIDTVLEATVKLDHFSKSPYELFNELDTIEAVEEALLEDTERAVKEELDVKLWRCVIYTQIDAARRAIASASQLDEKKRISEHLDSIILAYLGRLDFILDRLKSAEGTEAVQRIRLKLTLYTGDLLRYRCSHNGVFKSFDAFVSAQERYLNAIEIDPQDGTAFNQLSVLETLQEAKKLPLKILFYYARAAVSKKPFNTAKENIIRLSRKAETLEEPLMKLTRRLIDGRPAEQAFEEAMKCLSANDQDKFYFLAAVKAVSLAFASNFNVNFQDELLAADENLLKLLIGSEIIDESALDSRHEPLQLPLSQSNEFEAAQDN